VQLVIDIRKFSIVTGATPAADLDLSVKIAQKGTIVASQVFREHEPLASADTAGAAKALDQAFGRIARKIVPWVAQAIAAHKQSSGDAP
jgi:phospholipid/cholesterol/gamma-HCH transport system substrate-binding protein